MAITERDRTRLDALIAIIKPANSLAARVEKLTPDQREQYETFKARWDRFIDHHPDGDAYELTLNGYGPCLPDAIENTLNGEMPRILKTDGDDKAAQIYQRYCHG
jgi:hypothetical protein